MANRYLEKIAEQRSKDKKKRKPPYSSKEDVGALGGGLLGAGLGAGIADHLTPGNPATYLGGILAGAVAGRYLAKKYQGRNLRRINA